MKTIMIILLCYAIAVDLTKLISISTISLQQAKPIESVYEEAILILNC